MLLSPRGVHAELQANHKMKGSPRVELHQASKVSEAQFELSFHFHFFTRGKKKKKSFHNGNVRFPVTEV